MIYDERHSPSLPIKKFRSTGESKRVYALLGHAQLALLAARNGDRPTYQMHIRRATTMTTNGNANVMVTSRSVMAAAYQQEFDSALAQLVAFRGKRGLNSQTESPESVAFYLGEARLTLGRQQMNHSDKDGGSTDGAKKTLASLNAISLFDVLLTSEIAAAAVRADDLGAAVTWMDTLKNQDLKAAAMVGIASGLVAK